MKIFLSILAASATLALAACYTNPVTGRQSLVLVSEGQELQLGKDSFDDVKKKEKISTDAAANERVQRVGQKIAKAVGEQMPDAKWEFVVFESPQINAFALPGGKVGVYSGLLKLAATDDELAIVMGHEIGHVVARHGAERMSESMVIAGVGAIGSAVAEQKYDAQTRDLFALAYGGLTTVGRILPHSRQNESEADKMGMIFAAKAGYDPRAAITFWQKMEQESAKHPSQMPALLSTHPADDKRIADLRAYLPQVLPTYEANREST